MGFWSLSGKTGPKGVRLRQMKSYMRKGRKTIGMSLSLGQTLRFQPNVRIGQACAPELGC